MTKKKTQDHKIVIHVTAEQLTRLQKLADRKGLGVGPMLRSLGLEAAAEVQS